MIHPAGRPERPGLEVPDVLRRHGPAYTHARERRLGRVETRVISSITACRTAALGGHVEACADCGATRITYNSCRNRHCPSCWKRVCDTTCQGAARVAWLEARQAELPPVPYFHIVFTLPQPIAAIAFQNKRLAYATLFRGEPMERQWSERHWRTQQR